MRSWSTSIWRCGDAAAVAGALVSDPGALLALTSAPSVEAVQVIAALAPGAVSRAAGAGSFRSTPT